MGCFLTTSTESSLTTGLCAWSCPLCFRLRTQTTAATIRTQSIAPPTPAPVPMAVVFVLVPGSEVEAVGVVDTAPDSVETVPVGLDVADPRLGVGREVADPGLGVGGEVANPISAVDGPKTAPIKVNTTDSVLQHLVCSFWLSQQYSA
jgi:hypothetical protein